MKSVFVVNEDDGEHTVITHICETKEIAEKIAKEHRVILGYFDEDDSELVTVMEYILDK